MAIALPAADAPRAAAPPSLARLLALLLPAAMAMYGAFQGTQMVLLPLQLQGLDAAHKVVNLAGVTMLCAVTGVLGMTWGGAATDVTFSRWGRRAPWLAGMAAASSLTLVAIGWQSRLVAIAALCGVFWFTLNFYQGALLTVLPDRVSDAKRGFASSIFALAGPIGAVAGINAAAYLPGWPGFCALALAIGASAAAYLLLAPEPPALAPRPRDVRADAAGHGLIRRFLGSFRRRDFALAYAFRALMFTGQSTINNYLLYILQDHIGWQRLPGHSPEVAAGVVSTLRTVATLAAIGIGIVVARRTTRRKIFAQGYALAMAFAMLIPLFSPTWAGMLAFAGLGGAAMGAYSTIDLALMAHVLPDKRNAGRDLGLLAMAGAFAQLLAPPIGGAIIRFLGYDSLFLAGAAITIAAGLAAGFMRGVR